MPPKVKITKEDIINATVQLVRENGERAINARAVATALNCSTQPVFSNFQAMEELRAATLAAVYEIYSSFLKREAENGEYPKYKAFGMAYIRFAKEEKELFKLLFMRDRTEENTAVTTDDVEASVEYIMNSSGVTREKALLMHLEIWTSVHGIAVMIATSFLSFDWKMIGDMLSDVYQGIRLRHTEVN